MKAVILCAGLGTRLRPITNTLPKVMVMISGKPLLQHHIEWLVGNGIVDIGINQFYLSEIIVNHFGDGSRFGARIHYSPRETLSETATHFKKFKEFIRNDDCLIIYGDNMFSLDLNDFITYHRKKGGIATIALKEWENPGEKGIVGLDNDDKILWFKEKPKPEDITTNIGNAGIYLVRHDILSHIPDDRDYDFGKDIFPALLKTNENIYGYRLSGYHIDIGTINMLEKARRDYPVIFSNKAVFIDRDGVLNKKAPDHDYVKSFDEFSWNDGAKELVKSLKKLGFLVIVISNQQGIAKDKMTNKFVDSLHEHMNKELAILGTKIDGFYYCPHFKEDGCSCRKPSPGLIFKAASEHKIDLSKSYMIGDSESDIQTGKRAGCKTILTSTDTIDVVSILGKLS